MPLPPDPVAFVIPFLNREVYWYGLMVTLGVLVGAFVADREARRREQNPDHVWNALIVVMIFGLVGARLYHVLSAPAEGATSLQTYLDDPVSIVAFWRGGLRGLGIIGAIIGGVFGLWLYAKWQKLSFPLWADICVIGVPLGQAIGRWGNYFNQELFGRATELPWGLPVDDLYRLPSMVADPPGTLYHPTFLYESLWCLLVFFVLSFVAHHWQDRLVVGDVALLYLILYPLGRYFVELQRPDAWMIGGVPAAQIAAVVTMFVAALWILVRHGFVERLMGRTAEAV